MDIDLPLPSLSWADQMELEDAIPPLKHIDLESALPTQEQMELEYAPSSLTPPHVEHMDAMPPPPLSINAQMDVNPSVIPYDVNAPTDPSLWDGQFQSLSILGIKETFDQDTANIISSLDRAAAYIRQRDLKGGDPNILT